MDRERQENLSIDAREKIRLLGLATEYIVQRFAGRTGNRICLLSEMPFGFSVDELVDALMHRRMGDFFRVRRFVEDAVFMMGQLARRINSHLLPRIIDLHIDLMRLQLMEDGRCQDEKEACRLVREFEYCHDALETEIAFMDVRERANIWPKAPVHPADKSGRREVFRPEKGMTSDEATQRSRAAELRNHRRKMKMIGFAKKVAALTSCFSRLADDAQRGIASASSEHSPDWHALSEMLETHTHLRYCKFTDVDLYLSIDPWRLCEYADIGTDSADEETEETHAKQRMDGEIIRYVDAAIALARSVKSESASGFVLAKSLFEKYEGTFSDAYCHISVKADLATFIDTLKSAHDRLHADVAAAKLGGESPVRVELTKKSGETIAKAVRPGRGGARRVFSEEVQEKCWHYWEIGRKNPDVAQIAEASGRKLRHEDVFNYFRRELAALEPPIDTPEAFKSALRARTNRISRKKSH